MTTAQELKGLAEVEVARLVNEMSEEEATRLLHSQLFLHAARAASPLSDFRVRFTVIGGEFVIERDLVFGSHGDAILGSATSYDPDVLLRWERFEDLVRVMNGDTSFRAVSQSGRCEVEAEKDVIDGFFLALSLSPADDEPDIMRVIAMLREQYDSPCEVIIRIGQGRLLDLIAQDMVVGSMLRGTIGAFAGKAVRIRVGDTAIRDIDLLQDGYGDLERIGAVA